MRLHLDLDLGRCSIHRYVVCCIRRNPKKRITYNSGPLYFTHKEAVNSFKEFISTSDNTLEIIDVDVYKAHEPQEGGERKGYWCPYCQRWEYWKSNSLGYKVCPICGVGDSEYYVKKYNQMWTGTMQSQKVQKSMDKAKNNHKKGKGGKSK